MKPEIDAITGVQNTLKALQTDACGFEHHLHAGENDKNPNEEFCTQERRNNNLGCAHNGDVNLRACINALLHLGVVSPEEEAQYIERLNRIAYSGNGGLMQLDVRHLQRMLYDPNATDQELLREGQEAQRPGMNERARIRDELLRKIAL